MFPGTSSNSSSDVSVYAYGAPDGHRSIETRSANDPAAVMRYLCRQAARFYGLPEAQRAERLVEEQLTQRAITDGYSGIRAKVRSCLEGFLRLPGLEGRPALETATPTRPPTRPTTGWWAGRGNRRRPE